MNEKLILNPGNKHDIMSFLSDEILARWNPEISAGLHDDDDDEEDKASATINIDDIIGRGFFTEGITAKTVARALNANEGKAINVNINSPGGDFFEGVAIFNLLNEHEGDVRVKIIGLAASAASMIAMAGDTISIPESAFIMIHNTWNIVLGNKEELRAEADTLEKFDASMTGVFSKKTGISKAEIADMLAAETWLGGAEAVEKGFATDLLDSEHVVEDDSEQAKFKSSLKEIESALRESGCTRSERRAHIKNLTNKPGAVVKDAEAMPSAGDNDKLAKAVLALTQTLSI